MVLAYVEGGSVPEGGGGSPSKRVRFGSCGGASSARCAAAFCLSRASAFADRAASAAHAAVRGLRPGVAARARHFAASCAASASFISGEGSGGCEEGVEFMFDLRGHVLFVARALRRHAIRRGVRFFRLDVLGVRFVNIRQRRARLVLGDDRRALGFAGQHPIEHGADIGIDRFGRRDALDRPINLRHPILELGEDAREARVRRGALEQVALEPARELLVRRGLDLALGMAEPFLDRRGVVLEAR